MNLDTNITPSTRINSKWKADLNVKPKTLKPLEDYIRKNLHELWNGNDFSIFSNMECFMNLHVILAQGPANLIIISILVYALPKWAWNDYFLKVWRIRLHKNEICSSKYTIWYSIDKTSISSVIQLCLTLFSPMNRSTPGFPVHYHLPELTQTHVHWVGDAIQPSHPLSSPSPPVFNLSQLLLLLLSRLSRIWLCVTP